MYYRTFFSGEESSGEGVKKSEAVNWYLEQISEDIDTQEELVDRKLVIEKVIHRLIHKVSGNLPILLVVLSACNSQ